MNILESDKRFPFVNLNSNSPENFYQNEVYYSLIKLNGLGYRAWHVGDKMLILDIGYSHYLTFDLRTPSISLIIRKNRIFLYSQDNINLNNLVNFISSFKRPNPYNLKGIRVMKKHVFKKARKKDRVR